MEGSDVHTESYEHTEEQVPETVLPVIKPLQIITIPEEAEPAPEAPVPVEKKSRRSLFIAMGTGALVVVGAAVGVGYLAGQRHPDDTVAQSADKDKQASLPALSASPVATSEPTETPSPNVSEDSAEGFPTTLSSGDLAREVIKRAFTDWRSAGVDADIVSNVDKSGLGLGQYSSKIPSQNAKRIADSLFIDGWQHHSDLSTYEQLMDGQNLRAIDLGYVTAKQPEPFAWTDTIESVNANVGSQEADEIIIVTETNNAANDVSKNTALAVDSTLETQNNQQLHFDVRMIRVGDAFKISSIAEVALAQ